MIYFDNGGYFAYESAGEFHSEGTWIHPVRTINTYEILLVLEGRVQLRDADTAYNLLPGDVIVLEPGREHGGTAETNEKVAFYWFHFRTNLPVEEKYCALKDAYQLRQLLKRLLHVSNAPACDPLEMDASGYLVYGELRRQFREKDQVGIHLLEQVKEYIRVHVRQRLTVRMVAEHFGYHPDYLGKVFQKHFQMGLKDYLNLQRIKCMKDLLLTTEKTVKQIAFEMGYTHENLFTKFFLYHEKIGPSEFRNQYCNTHLNNH